MNLQNCKWLQTKKVKRKLDTQKNSQRMLMLTYSSKMTKWEENVWKGNLLEHKVPLAGQRSRGYEVTLSSLWAIYFLLHLFVALSLFFCFSSEAQNVTKSLIEHYPFWVSQLMTQKGCSISANQCHYRPHHPWHTLVLVLTIILWLIYRLNPSIWITGSHCQCPCTSKVVPIVMPSRSKKFLLQWQPCMRPIYHWKKMRYFNKPYQNIYYLTRENWRKKMWSEVAKWPFIGIF